MIHFLCWLAVVCELSRAGIKPMESGLPLSDNDPVRPGQLEYG